MTVRGRAPRLTAPAIAQLARLTDDSSRSRYFRSRHRFIHEAVVEQLAEAVRERVHVNVREATALSEAALVVATRVASDTAMARALRAKANAHRFRNDLKPAVKLFDEAARLFERSGSPLELGRTLSSSIKTRILLSDYDGAMDAALRAKALFSSIGDERGLARLAINVANVLHRQDRFAEALDAYEQALERLIPLGDTEGIGVALHNMSVCLIVLNDFERALATHERARAHCASAGMNLLVAQADYNIAYLHFFRGDYSRALDMLRTARVACEAVGDRYHTGLCDLDSGEIYLELNLSSEAADMALEALQVFGRLGNGYEEARARTNLAIAFAQQGEASRALELFAQARSQFERERNAAWPSVIDCYQSLVLLSVGRYGEARRLAISALGFFTAWDQQRKGVLCELLLGQIDLETGALSDAAMRSRSALAKAEAIEAPALAYQALFLQGRIEEAAGDPQAAYITYLVARDRLETLRSALAGEELKIAFMTTKMAVYERLVEICLHRNGDERSPEEIFGYIEQAKSRSLRDLFFESIRTPSLVNAGDGHTARQIRKLREELNWFYHRIEFEQLNGDDHSTERLKDLQVHLRCRESAFVKALRELPPEDRTSAGIHETSAATPSAIRATLTADMTIVEYFRTGDQVLAAVLTLDQLTVAPLTTIPRVRHLLRMLQFQLSKFQVGPLGLGLASAAGFEATQMHLHELYDELFAPLPLRTGGHVIVVPHDILHYVPFHALFDGRRYASDWTSISYAPSASIYALCCNRKVPSDGGALIYGVPDERAPFIADEVRAVAELLPDAVVRLGADASAETLRALGPGRRIVHIATHGSFREDNPLFSGVRLGDSYLTLHDLSSLPLPVDLVTLSGCGTGLNVVARGDELRGLVRGLLASGARSLLVSLWDVHDRSTAEFMKLFYGGLKVGLGKASAVRAAAAELRREYSHPYYWAPFVLVGATSAP